MLKGQIIFFRPIEATGYLRLVETREEFYFRLPRGRATGLKAGDWVSFQLQESKQGILAVEVKPWLVA